MQQAERKPGTHPGPLRRRVVAPWRRLLLCLALACPWPSGLRAQEPDDEPRPAYAEHELKAAYLFHFAAYVEWPGAQPETPLVFVILSAPDVAQALRRFADGRTVRARRVRVREALSPRELEAADVLFVGRHASRSLRSLAQTLPRGTLLVSDKDDGLAAGAMINFRLVQRRVRFEVSLPATHAAGLRLSSRLLSVAMHVDTPP